MTIERSFAYALAIAIACAPGVSAQQDQGPKFRADVNRVLIDVAVSDSSGRAVDSLRADDFHVFDNGIAQTITSADYIRPGVRLNLGHASKTSARSSELPVSSGAGPWQGLQGEDNARKSQFHTVVIDDLNIAANHIASIREGMTALVDRHLGRDDYFAIVRTGRAPQDWCDFTNDPGRLRAAIDKITWNPASSQQLGNAEPTYSDFLKEDPGGRDLAGRVQGNVSERAYRGSFRVLYGVITRLKQIPGRRSLVVISDSLPQSVLLGGLIEYANRNWVSVSTISSRGVDAAGFTAQDKTNNADRMNTAVVRADLAARAEESGRFTTSLEVLAHGTGGMAFVSNDLSDALTQALDNSQGYYLISFRLSEPGDSKKGKHNILVKVGPRGLTIHTRSSFYAFPSSGK